ncbi:RNA-directed DNA polymerase from mobile element jockey-like [Elysia marginata]|uniref:RNA-directed DNA polymerase from mobile element jockey-like n=1 Tax=Elysia marginata TaxID=1093978 RepID=A0AAV4IZQ4_9GAST|nr:RNA-directed DNA polymerase from mobile element jockey-like [Elysia marginata]
MAGNDVIQWAEKSNATLLYNPKGKGTLKSACWRKEFTPGLALFTQNNKGSFQATREVHTDFPRSQHRPTVITTSIIIPRILIQEYPNPAGISGKLTGRLTKSTLIKPTKG